VIIHEFATLCLAHMAVEYTTKVQIFEQGGLEPLISLLGSPDPDVTKNSVECIYLLVQVKFIDLEKNYYWPHGVNNFKIFGTFTLQHSSMYMKTLVVTLTVNIADLTIHMSGLMQLSMLYSIVRSESDSDVFSIKYVFAFLFGKY